MHYIHYISIKLKKKKKEKRIRIQSLKIMTTFRDISYIIPPQTRMNTESTRDIQVPSKMVTYPTFPAIFINRAKLFSPPPDFLLSALPAASYAPLISSSRRLLPHGSRLQHVLTTPSLRIFSRGANSFFLP